MLVFLYIPRYSRAFLVQLIMWYHLHDAFNHDTREYTLFYSFSDNRCVRISITSTVVLLGISIKFPVWKGPYILTFAVYMRQWLSGISMHLESLGSLVQHRMLGPPGSFWVSKSGAGLENAQGWQVHKRHRRHRRCRWDRTLRASDLRNEKPRCRTIFFFLSLKGVRKEFRKNANAKMPQVD